MCGIAGILQPGPSHFDQSLLNEMTNALAHRGPDASGCWQNPSATVALAHRRLSIIDLSDLAGQPMHYLDRYVIIHNGEIYNYIELRQTLQKLGYQFLSSSDTEVIAAAYDQWKDECLQKLDGMFAFVIWDEKEKILFGARDRFGEKPFFYHHDGSKLYFASEMKALWAAGIERSPNLRMLFNFLTIGYTGNPEDPAETFFEKIKKLPPACYMTCEPGSTPRIHQYWDLDPEKKDKKIPASEAIERFNELFRASVKKRLRSDVTLGCSLSGGIDSSAVLASIMDPDNGVNASGFRAFTAIFPGFEKNEYEKAREVATRFGVHHHVIEVNTNNFADEWERMMQFQEEPAGSSSIYPQYKVFELAAQTGIRVLLDGQGADEILGGYTRYYKWFWQELFRKGRLYRSGEIRMAKKEGVTESFGLRNMIAALFPEMASVILEKQYLLKALRHEDLHPDFVKQQSGEAYYATPPYFSLNGVLHFNTCEYGLEELLRYADRNAMAHGREVRLPFLGHELVEFVFSLPATMKIHEGKTKWILREAFKNKLPSSLISRVDKIGFEPPQKKWMAEPIIQEMIRNAKESLIQEGVLKKNTLEKEILPKGAHEPDNYDWRYLSAVSVFK